MHISSLMRDPRGHLFAGIHGVGLYRSRDDGATWQLARNGIAEDHVFSLACRETKTGVELYAGTEPAHLYRSTDDGEHWQELPGVRDVASVAEWNFPAPPFQPHVKHVAFDPRDERVLYVCVEQGALLKSDDGGRTFRDVPFQDKSYVLNKDTHRVIFNPRNPDEIFLPGGDGIATSRDAGKSWRHLTTPQMRVAYPDHFYVSPEDDGVLFAAGGGDPPNVWRETGDARSAIVTSRDNGESWARDRGRTADVAARQYRGGDHGAMARRLRLRRRHHRRRGLRELRQGRALAPDRERPRAPCRNASTPATSPWAGPKSVKKRMPRGRNVSC